MQSTRDLDRETLQLFCFGTIVLWTLGNSSVAPMIELMGPNSNLEYLLLGWFGIVGAQLALHSVMVILWETRLWRRIGWGIVSAVIPFFGFALGASSLALTKKWDWSEYGEVIVPIAGCLPLFMLAAQFPLWMFRFCFGWRIASGKFSGSEPKAKSWRIQDLMWGTAAVAVALALMRLAKPDDISSDDFFGFILAATCAILVISLTYVAISVLGILRSSHGVAAVVGSGSMILVMYAVILIIGTILEASPPPLNVYIGLGALLFGFGFSTIVPLLILRSFGYRLYLHREAAAVRIEGMHDVE